VRTPPVADGRPGVPACLQNEGIAAVVMDADTIYVTGRVLRTTARHSTPANSPSTKISTSARTN
jgi:hypothetical protein